MAILLPLWYIIYHSCYICITAEFNLLKEKESKVKEERQTREKELAQKRKERMVKEREKQMREQRAREQQLREEQLAREREEELAREGIYTMCAIIYRKYEVREIDFLHDFLTSRGAKIITQCHRQLSFTILQ